MNSIKKTIVPFLPLLLCAVTVLGLNSSHAATILFVGDSDIEGWRTTSVFPTSVNVGVGGYTCKNVNNKIEKYLSDYPSAEWIVLVCGENDLWDRSVSATFNDFMQIVNLVTNEGSGPRRVLYMGTKPEPSTTSLHKKYVKYDGKIRKKAVEMASLTEIPPLVMVDVYPIFDNIEKENTGALYQHDKLHLNFYGYEFWTLWAATALGEEGKCIIWMDNVCVETKVNGTSTAFATPSPAAMAPLIFAGAEMSSCPSVYQKITSIQGCMDAVPLIGAGNFAGEEHTRRWPTGCYFCDNVPGCMDGVWFNTHPQGQVRDGTKLLCALPGWEVLGDDYYTTEQQEDDDDADDKEEDDYYAEEDDDN